MEKRIIARVIIFSAWMIICTTPLNIGFDDIIVSGLFFVNKNKRIKTKAFSQICPAIYKSDKNVLFDEYVRSSTWHKTDRNFNALETILSTDHKTARLLILLHFKKAQCLIMKEEEIKL